MRTSAAVLMFWCWCRSISARWSRSRRGAHLQHLAADRGSLTHPPSGFGSNAAWRNLFENNLTCSSIPHGLVSAVDRGGASCVRCGPFAPHRAVLKWRAGAGKPRHCPSRRRHRHLRASGAVAARAAASTDRNSGADRRRDPRRAASWCAARAISDAPSDRCQRVRLARTT